MQEKLKKIKCLICDVDGVMTDTTVQWNGTTWVRRYSVIDGVGILMAAEAGIITAVITASDAEDVRLRVKHLKFDHFYEKSRNKIKDLENLLDKLDLSPDQVCYIGDDLMDIEVIEAVGLGVTVPDAVEKVKNSANYVTKRQGGFGAVREVCELLIDAQ